MQELNELYKVWVGRCLVIAVFHHNVSIDTNVWEKSIDGLHSKQQIAAFQQVYNIALFIVSPQTIVKQLTASVIEMQVPKVGII